MLKHNIATTIIYFALPNEIIKNPDGTYSLSPERLAKKENEKKKIDNHEVYRLTAVKNGTYICWDCPDGTIYLRAGMIWRYGITSNSRRYSDAQLIRWGVKYTPFYWGDLAECRKVEKDYIYGYPELPEYPMVVDDVLPVELTSEEARMLYFTLTQIKYAAILESIPEAMEGGFYEAFNLIKDKMIFQLEAKLKPAA